MAVKPYTSLPGVLRKPIQMGLESQGKKEGTLNNSGCRLPDWKKGFPSILRTVTVPQWCSLRPLGILHLKAALREAGRGLWPGAPAPLPPVRTEASRTRCEGSRLLLHKPDPTHCAA